MALIRINPCERNPLVCVTSAGACITHVSAHASRVDDCQRFVNGQNRYATTCTAQVKRMRCLLLPHSVSSAVVGVSYFAKREIELHV